MFTAFISDLHLGPERPEMAAAFLRFMGREARQAQSLYILGDLFEHWVGDDALEDSFNAGIAGALRDLTSQGVPVMVMHGNRDFLLGRRFEEVTGVRLLADPSVIDLYGRRTLLTHGDALCTDDTRYQAFRTLVRRPWMQRLLLALPKAVRLSLARRARRLSQNDKSRKAMSIMDVTPGAVEHSMRQHGCQHLIHGHTHRPANHSHLIDGRTCQRIVLADWYEQGEYLRCDAHGCSRQPLG